MTLEQYRDEQLATLKQRLNQGIEALRVKLREDLKADFEQKVEALRRDIEAKSNRAIQDFNTRVTEVEKMRRDGTPAMLLDPYEQSLKDSLRSTLDFHQRAFEGFVTLCQQYLR